MKSSKEGTRHDGSGAALDSGMTRRLILLAVKLAATSSAQEELGEQDPKRRSRALLTLVAAR